MQRPLDEIITNLGRDADGVWRTPAHSRVSYSDQGHDTCHGVEDGSFWFAHRNRCIAAAIQHAPPDPGLPFADVGGGNGFVAAMIRDLGYRVVLVEPGAAGIAHARERGLHELVQASIVDLDVAPRSLGAIGLFDVIEHIERDGDALLALRGMLSDGGKIYATVPAHRWLWSGADEQAGHFRRYTARQLQDLFRRCGFTVDLCSYTFWPLPLPMYLMRTLPERLHLRGAGTPRRARVEGEHRQRGQFLERLLALEEKRLRQGRRMPFGASLIVAATKTAAAPA
jgi:SAM-dependent methyltransferase